MSNNLESELDAVLQVLSRPEHAIGLSARDEPLREMYNLATYWLAKIYIRADWLKIARSKNVYREDVFDHKVKASLSEPTVRRINEKLCEELGLQSVSVPTSVFDKLETNSRFINNLRREVVYITLKAMEIADVIYNEKLLVRK